MSIDITKAMTNEQLAAWFTDRAAGLSRNTGAVLVQLGLAPVCMTGSFAKDTGSLYDRHGARKHLPTISDAPRELAGKMISVPLQSGTEICLLGDLGGIDNQAEYMLVRLEDVELYDSIVRVSCRGTVYEFVRHPKGWVASRTEAA